MGKIRCHHNHTEFIFSPKMIDNEILMVAEWCKYCGAIKIKNSRGNLSKWYLPKVRNNGKI